MSDSINTANDFMVGVTGSGVLIMFPPTKAIQKEDAIRLAAWILALADPDLERFNIVFEAMMST